MIGDMQAQERQDRFEAIPVPGFEQLEEANTGPLTLPEWVFDDPKGSNALTTITTVEGKELTRQVQYLNRFGFSTCAYDGRESKMMVARTQDEFDRIIRFISGGEPRIKAPRKLNFEDEMFVFCFAGTKGANWRTVIEVESVDRNGGPIKKGDLVLDAVHVRVHIDHMTIGEKEGFSPWTMYRINKKELFKEHALTDDTSFVLIEARAFCRTANEDSVPK